MKQGLNQKRLRNKFLKQGVKMSSPETIFFSNKTKIGKNVYIEPYVVFVGNVIYFPSCPSFYQEVLYYLF